jgi:hypothetical protein
LILLLADFEEEEEEGRETTKVSLFSWLILHSSLQVGGDLISKEAAGLAQKKKREKETQVEVKFTSKTLLFYLEAGR